jgi:hypothetical protein
MPNYQMTQDFGELSVRLADKREKPLIQRALIEIRF